MKLLKIAAIVLSVALLTAFFSEMTFTDTEKDIPDGIYAGICDTVTDYAGFAEGKAIVGAFPVSAKSAILCTDGGILLYEKQADIPLPMASITKVMTAIAVLENVNDVSDYVTVPQKAVGTEGSSVYLKAGEKITCEALLYALLLESANDAAVCLAISVSGSVEEFAALMNEKAASLSMNDTVFKNPHGLYEDGHYTTARDYAKLMSYALKNETFRKIISTKKYAVKSDGGEMTRVMTNHNRLLNTYKYMIGGKTGYTKASGRTLVTAAEKDGTTLICVTLNASDDWNDHTSLFEAGFGLVETKTYSVEDLSVKTSVVCGETDSLLCAPDGEYKITLENGKNADLTVFLPRIVFAPVRKGETLGYVLITSDGAEEARLPLKAAFDVPLKTEKEKTKSGSLRFFKR